MDRQAHTRDTVLAKSREMAGGGGVKTTESNIHWSRCLWLIGLTGLELFHTEVVTADRIDNIQAIYVSTSDRGKGGATLKCSTMDAVRGGWELFVDPSPPPTLPLPYPTLTTLPLSPHPPIPFTTPPPPNCTNASTFHNLYWNVEYTIIYIFSIIARIL